MRGTYNFYRDGRQVGSAQNVVTWEGKRTILRYLAGLNDGYAGTIAVGISNTPALITNTSLDYEIARAPVNMRSVKSYGTPTGTTLKDGQIVFRGTLPESFVAKIYEVGLLSAFSTNYAAQRSPSLISGFESNSWTISASSNVVGSTDVATSTTGNTPVRIGSRGMQFYDSTTTANRLRSFTIRNDLISGDYGRYSSADVFTFSAIVSAAQTAGMNIQVKFCTDSTNYFTGTFNTGTITANVDNYVIMKQTKSSFIASTAVANWSSIQYAEIIFPAQSSPGTGPFTFLLDGLSIFPTALLTPDAVTVSRAILTTPLSKELGKTLDVEYVVEFDL